MSDSKETVRRMRDDSPIIDSVCGRLDTLVDPSETVAVRTFATVFLRKAPRELLHIRGVDDLAHMVLGAFRFLQTSKGARVDVQVVNPDSEVEGWASPVTVVRTNVGERPFVVDSIREFLHAQDLSLVRMVYPVLDVERDAAGGIVRVGPHEDGETKESLVHCEVGRISDPEMLEFIRAELGRRLEDVVRATDDFPAMIDAVNGVVAGLAEWTKKSPEREDEVTEIQAFLRWLRDGRFIFLGYRGYDIVAGPDGERAVVVEEGSGLGVLRSEVDSRFAAPVPVSSLDAAIRALAERGPILIISKTNAESTVHRRARMDYIGLKKMGADGEAIGEHRFIGLFTSKAFSEDADNIPILRRKLAQIVEESAAREGSHDYKEIITIFNKLPKEELFLSSAEQVGEDIKTVLTSYHTHEVRVTVREDTLKRGVSIMVILPRDRFSGTVRRAIEAELVAMLDGEVLNYYLAMGEGDQARLHFYVSGTEDRIKALDADALEQSVGLLIRTWTDLMWEGLGAVCEVDEAARLVREYGAAFDAEYQAATDPDIAVGDVVELEAMRAEGRSISISFANRGAAVAGVDDATELKVYLLGERLILSDFMPILEAAGFRVIAVKPFEVGPGDELNATIYVFAVQDSDGNLIDVEGRGALISETILAARAGDVISDSLNALVLLAGLHWREVDVLRGYTGYAFQIGAVPSRKSVPSALVQYPGIAKELFDLFSVKFDPASDASTKERKATAKDIRTAFHGSLHGVSLLANDRALRRIEELISATLRTNFYRHGGKKPTFRSGGVPYISFKFSCKAVENLKRSGLLFEVWVHSARVEGVHLRGAKVARGGVRWSDRPDDFRTEILGLVKTQMVKNAVIVPAGSKGGFVTRLMSADPEERFAEGRLQYETLQRGLLDLTDNIVGGKTVPPPGVISYDRPDPYLVVAADKGTATFSDVANAISREYGFWLDDAYASGGSNGYDHKAVGITARGGWECVKRHFREQGKDIQTEPFTVAGIGDMSGDVFGNGMILSEQIRLIAAFDHRHIFLDPNPDSATTFVERKRLFDLGRSSWSDYDAALLSEGGMIVPRGSKEVELTPQVRAALGLAEGAPTVMDGETLIRAVLCAPVELLWNGGIGTYVKAASETHADAGDPSNDAVRIDDNELRCLVVGEGGNLGFTQRARVEFALRGGCLNTDAIDNSGGVDMSDHEVNLKILLAPAVASGAMTEERRNQLLEEMTDSVAAHVLNDNHSQSLAISLDEVRAKESNDEFRDLMFSLEKSGQLDRLSERLPTLDVLVERRERGQALVRPELCVLLAYSKLSLMTELLASPLPDDPVTESYLLGYFPSAAMLAAGREALEGHRLRREIIASQLTNDLVDLMGATFLNRLARDTGMGAEQVVRAWLVASRLADHRALLQQMGEQSAMNSRITYR